MNRYIDEDRMNQSKEKTMDFVPPSDGGLGRILDNSAIKICNLTP